MKIEIELDEEGYCKEFKIDGKSYSKGIERVVIDCEYKTKIDMYIDEYLKEKELLENDLINFYSKK